jgi:hypothetical protein
MFTPSGEPLITLSIAVVRIYFHVPSGMAFKRYLKKKVKRIQIMQNLSEYWAFFSTVLLANDHQ